jgi:hypothetical protein
MTAIRVTRRLFRNPVATWDAAIVADIHRIRDGRLWEATLRPYADNVGPDQCPVGVVRGVSRKHLRAVLNDRLNTEGPWWE